VFYRSGILMVSSWGKRLSVTAGLVSASLIWAAVPADASPPESASAVTAQSSDARYSDRDVVDFLVFGRGAIAESKPELVEAMNTTPVLDAPASITDQLLAEFLEADPAFHDNVTVKAQAGDPYRAEESLKAFADVVQVVAAKHQAPSKGQLTAVPAGDVWAFSNYVVSTQVAVAAAVAVSVLGVVAALAVIAYQRPGEETALVRQTYASKWAGL
jgi:SdpC family antimicrobial peptide